MQKLSIIAITLISGVLLAAGGCVPGIRKEKSRPNILILMSDNHLWNHLGCYGDPVLKTPNIDKLSEQGIRFTHAFCPAPSCSPARASMLTGQDIWRLEEAANLWSGFPPHFKVYTEILEEAGYHVGYEGKGWGPGDYKAGGRIRDPSGKKYDSFEEFYHDIEEGQPFCYWFNTLDPHRPYMNEGWKLAGIDPDEIEVPPYLPDVDDVRRDIGNYYSEVQNFDRDVGAVISILKEKREEENTLVIVCSDNGWQMPRGLANLYDFGTRVPLVVSMPSRYKAGRVVDDFVSLKDFAPTFLEIAGIPVPDEMNARSFVNILESGKEGMVDPTRNFIVTARERHAFVRRNGTGYGARAYRTKDFLYIRNYNPEYWPAGDPPLYGDVDAYMLHFPCPTKMYMLKNREEEGCKRLFELGFGKRPSEELYDLPSDPFQMNNVAGSPEFKEVKDLLCGNLTNYLKVQGDPRELGGRMKWMGAPYYAKTTAYPSEQAQRELNLEPEYSYTDQE